MNNLRNEAGVKNARMGYCQGVLCLFTHKNPATGKVFAERGFNKEGGELKELPFSFGNGWVDGSSVRWCSQN